MTEEEREARNGLLCLNLEAPPEVCRDVRLKIEFWVAAAERTVRAEAAALVRAVGCSRLAMCDHLKARGMKEHDYRCPLALAAAIERGELRDLQAQEER